MDELTLIEKLTKGKEQKFFVSVVPVSFMGEVLLGKRTEDGIWTTPGGGAEPGEEPHEAARRELFEEAGLAAPSNALELVNVSETPRGFKIYSFLWRMPRELAQIATSKLDPDQEVKSWKLFRPESFPGAMSTEKNASRLKTIREALMRFYGVAKSTEQVDELCKSMTPEQRQAFLYWVTAPECQGETVEDLTNERLSALAEKLDKGGPGSGVKGHKTPHIRGYTYTHSTEGSNHIEHHYDRDGGDHQAPDSSHDTEEFGDYVHEEGKKHFGHGRMAGSSVGYDTKRRRHVVSLTERKPKVEKAMTLEKGDWKETTKNGVRYYVNGPHAGKKVGSVRVEGHHAGPDAKPHPKPAHDPKQFQHLVDLSFEMQDHGSEFPQERIAHLPDNLKLHAKAVMRAADEFHETDEDSPKYGAAEKKLGDATSRFQQAAKTALEQDKVKAPSKLQTHLHMLNHGGVMPHLQTQSGKPIVTNMDAARAHGYEVQDHVDAMNAHYELGQKTQSTLEKLKTAGHKVPEEGAKIAQFHEKQMKDHMRARQALESRQKRVDEAMHPKVKKSTTQAEGGTTGRDITTGDFAQTNSQADTEWMKKLYEGMADAEFGADPRLFNTPKGALHLCKVDDGLYSGYFTRDENGLLDNDKIRIERTTIPELVQLMVAREWIANHVIDQAPADLTSLQAKLETPVAPEVLAQQPQVQLPPPPAPPVDRSLLILELLAKLIG